jgi:hypothetical protein
MVFSIPIPPYTSISYSYFVSLITLGWGRISSNGLGSKTLKQAKFEIASDKVCKKQYGIDFIKFYTHVCAGDPASTSSTCQGDSGGPLVCEERGRWFVHGATSFGRSCSLKFYTVYTRINKYLRWIYKRIGGTYTIYILMFFKNIFVAISEIKIHLRCLRSNAVDEHFERPPVITLVRF